MNYLLAVFMFDVQGYLLQAFSSDSSLQSGFPLQKSSLSIQSPLPQDNLPSGHTGSSVFKIGRTFLGSESLQNIL